MKVLVAIRDIAKGVTGRIDQGCEYVRQGVREEVGYREAPIDIITFGLPYYVIAIDSLHNYNQL